MLFAILGDKTLLRVALSFSRVLQMRKLRPREVKAPAQGRTAGNSILQNLDS